MLHSRTCTDKSCALSRNDGSSILQNVKHFIQHDTPRPAILLVISQDLSVKLVLPLINTSCKTKVFCLESHPMSQKINCTTILERPRIFRVTLYWTTALLYHPAAGYRPVYSWYWAARLISSRTIEISCIDVCPSGGYYWSQNRRSSESGTVLVMVVDINIIHICDAMFFFLLFLSVTGILFGSLMS